MRYVIMGTRGKSDIMKKIIDKTRKTYGFNVVIVYNKDSCRAYASLNENEDTLVYSYRGKDNLNNTPEEKYLEILEILEYIMGTEAPKKSKFFNHGTAVYIDGFFNIEDINKLGNLEDLKYISDIYLTLQTGENDNFVVRGDIFEKIW